MRRYDALKPYRTAIEALWRDLPRDSLAGALLAPALIRSMSRMLEAAGAPLRTPFDLLRVKLLAGIHLSVMRVWLQDDSEDLGPHHGSPRQGVEAMGVCAGKGGAAEKFLQRTKKTLDAAPQHNDIALRDVACRLFFQGAAAIVSRDCNADERDRCTRCPSLTSTRPRFMADFKIPSFDAEGAIALHRKNVEAMTAASQTAFEGAAAFLRRQGRTCP